MSDAARFLVVVPDAHLAGWVCRRLSAFGRADIATTAFGARHAFVDHAGVVVDAVLPDGPGVGLVRSLRARRPALPALVLSGHVDGARLVEAHALRATYLLVPCDPAALDLFAARATHRRHEVLDELVAQTAKDAQLTDAEASILKQAIRGTRRDELAAVRDVAESTIKKQISIMRDKLGASLEDVVFRLLRSALDLS